VQRGAALIRHLLAFSRQQPLRPTEIDLISAITRMRDTVLRTLGEEVSLDVITQPTLWAARADLSQLEAALLNLCLNARDAMNGAGQITLSCRNVSVNDVERVPGSDLASGDYVAISVSDTGPGMSHTTAALAFEPFFTTKEVGQGSGLGLSMVQGFSRQSGGDTTIWSQPGEGTRVTLYLPRAEGQPTPRSSAPPLAQVTGNGEHIHLLEDNPQVQLTVRKTLEALGYRITLSGDVDSALQAVAQGAAPDLVLADIILPGGRSGVDFANELRDKRPGIKVILMSGYPNLTPEQRGVLGRDYEFVKKPFEKGELSRVIRRVLDS
jgi:CheY-like chemotaxis protein